jgi:hypothetical protein
MNRFPCDARYIEALGRAVFNFALLEYAVVHTAEKIERAYLNKYIAKRKRAGMVARDFAEIVARAQGHPAAGKLTEISSTFTELVERRNKLLHANPATLADGTQALIYQTETFCWELDTVTAAAQAFEDAAAKTLDVLQKERFWM